jgi:hypothetical protein
MKIIDKTTRPDVVEFWEIEAGTCFKIDDSRFDTEDIFMRTNANMFHDDNVIRLVNGSLESLPTDTECILLDSELTVTIKK